MIFALFKQQIFWFLKQSFLLFWKPLFVESFQIWILNIFILWHKIYNILPHSIQIFLHQVGNFESKQICCDRKIRQIMKGWAELYNVFFIFYWDIFLRKSMKTFFMNGKYLRGMGTILHDQKGLKQLQKTHELANKLESIE